MTTPVIVKALLPDVELDTKGRPNLRQLATLPNLLNILGQLDMSIRYNLMKNEMELVGPGIAATEASQEKARVVFQDVLRKAHIPYQEFEATLSAHSRATTTYHPMADWIIEHAWDGVDRMETFAATVPTSTELWPQYIRKWFIQEIQAIFGGLYGQEPVSLPHVLTFMGGQGSNKGRWVNSLAPGDFVLTDAELHLDSGQAKDHMLQVLEHPIVELAELDSTFKRSHVSMMKAFLSRRVDKIRSPYARKATKRRRGTCFIGTVNDHKFLADATGSRRFWAVEIEGKLIWDHGIDMQQVFAQAHAEWMSGEDWNLTDDEDTLRDAINHRFQAVVYEVELLQAHLDSNRDNYDQYAVMNQTEILRTVGVERSLGSATGPVQQWLLDTLGKSRKLKAANGKVRYNAWPFPRALGYDGATFGEPLTVTDAKRLVKWDAPEGIEEMVEKINQATTTSTDTGTASQSG